MSSHPVISFLFLAALCSLLPPSAAVGEEPPFLLFRKGRPPSGTVDNGAGSTLTVREGDTISSLLAGMGISSNEAPSFIAEIMSLNPELSSPDRIFPGQKLVVPGMKAGAGTSLPLDPPFSSHEGAGTVTPLSAGGVTVGALRSRALLAPLLDRTFGMMGDRSSTNGTTLLPVPSAGTIAIDNERHPLLDLTTGRSIILDFDNTISAETAREIEGRWPRYRILSPSKGDELFTLFDSIFASSGYHSISRKQPVTLGREIKVRIESDFLIGKKPESLVEGDLYLVNVRSPGERGIPDEIRAMAAGHKITIVEILPEGGNDEERMDTPLLDRGGNKLTASDNRSLLFGLADYLDFEITVADDASAADAGYRGQSYLLERRGTALAVTFLEMRSSDTRSEKKGMENGTLYLTDNDSISDIIGGILKGLGIVHSGPEVEFFQEGGRYSFVLPGYHVHLEDHAFLMTEREVPPKLVSLLAARRIYVLTCGLIQQGQ